MSDLVSQLVGALGKFVERFKDHEDAGPRGETWQSDEFLAELAEARAALSAAKAGGWVSPYDAVPQPDQTVLVWSRQTWETAPSLKLDTWAMQREAPLSFSSATIETGYGWDDHEDFESVIAWQPLPAPPAQKENT